MVAVNIMGFSVEVNILWFPLSTETGSIINGEIPENDSVVVCKKHDMWCAVLHAHVLEEHKQHASFRPKSSAIKLQFASP